MPRNSQLSNEKDVEIGVKNLGDLESDGHAASRQREYDGVGIRDYRPKLLAKKPAGFDAIPEKGGHACFFAVFEPKTPCSSTRMQPYTTTRIYRIGDRLLDP